MKRLIICAPETSRSLLSSQDVGDAYRARVTLAFSRAPNVYSPVFVVRRGTPWMWLRPRRWLRWGMLSAEFER